MKTEILKILKTSPEAVSGQFLCEQLGKSRTAIWKTINQLKAEGYVIEAAQNKGYRLLSSPDIVSRDEIKSYMKTKNIGQEIYYYPVTESTNTTAKMLAEEGAGHGSLIVADVQTAGKGRRGRGWESPTGTGIFMSLLLKPEIEPSDASMMTLVMAMAVTKALKEKGVDAKIKWPNDVIIAGKKICGILTEMSTEIDFINYVVIGTGINVSTESFPEGLEDKATSIYKESGVKMPRAKLAAEVMGWFETYYEAFTASMDLSELRDEYNECLVNREAQVAVIEKDGTFYGQALGINHRGELLVKDSTGKTNNIYAGEVSVRGVYGYV